MNIDDLQTGDLVGVVGKRGTFRVVDRREHGMLLAGPITTGLRPGHDHRTGVYPLDKIRATGKNEPSGHADMHAGLLALAALAKARRGL